MKENLSGFWINAWNKDGKPHRIVCKPLDVIEFRNMDIEETVVVLKIDSRLKEHDLDKGKEINKLQSKCQCFLSLSFELLDLIETKRKQLKEVKK